MDDRFELLACPRIGEGVSPHALPVERSFRGDEFRAEGLFDLRDSRAAGGGRLPRDRIRVERRRAELREHLEHRALAAADAAGKADALRHGIQNGKAKGIQARMRSGPSTIATRPAPAMKGPKAIGMWRFAILPITISAMPTTAPTTDESSTSAKRNFAPNP